MHKKVKYLLIGVIVLIILVFIGINNVAPYAITQPPRINEGITPEQLGLNAEPLTIITEDKIELNGYWIKTEKDTSRGIMILLHGIGGCKEHFLGLSDELAKKGIESIVFDSRAHGKSGGEYCTYGYKEKKDIAKIVDQIKSRSPDLPIGIWGNSMGGAIAIQALEYDERIEFGVIESTFTELDQIVFDYKNRILKGFGIKSLSDFALGKAGKIGDFKVEEVRPIASGTHIEQPVFVAHGDADELISVEYGRQLFDSLKTINKELVIVKGAGHFNLFEKGGTEYKMEVMDFIDRNLE